MSACVRCGAEVRWITVEGEGKIPVDAQSTYNGRYALDSNDVNKGIRIDRPGHYGHENHDETCGQPIR